jgi:hypothetical protein
VTSSHDDQAKSASNPPAAVFRHWVHSREEDTSDLEVFRPDEFAFPPSFGRDGFEIKRNGQLIQDDIGPADGIVHVLGRWKSLGPQNVAVSFPGTARESYSFEIVAIDKSILQIRRREQPSRYASQPAMDETELQSFQARPTPTSFRLLDFEDAQILTLRSFPPQFVLRVSGTKPFANMHVELVPAVFIRQPEYWTIEVVGSLRDIGLPALAPYTVSISLNGIVGTSGIEVTGATRSERFDLFPDETPES